MVEQVQNNHDFLREAQEVQNHLVQDQSQQADRGNQQKQNLVQKVQETRPPTSEQLEKRQVLDNSLKKPKELIEK